jgi:hypothetical protein
MAKAETATPAVSSKTKPKKYDDWEVATPCTP